MQRHITGDSVKQHLRFQSYLKKESGIYARKTDPHLTHVNKNIQKPNLTCIKHFSGCTLSFRTFPKSRKKI